MPLAPGTILNNRYRVARLLGQGGFGAVYRVWDLHMDRPRALKENLETSPEAQRQFKREAQILDQLAHPNLPKVIDHFVIEGQGQYLVMDFVEGDDLGELLAQRGRPFTMEEIWPWVQQVCDALSYLHRRNPPVIHRDVKPANIRITPQGEAMLVDFGIAKVYDPQAATTLGARAATPGYSPIEQYGVGGHTDERSDVYSLGATLYTLLTGQIPPDAPNRVAKDTLLPLRTWNAAIAPAVEGVVLKALALQPGERYPTVAALRQALELALTQPTLRLPVEQNLPTPQAPPLPQERGLPAGARWAALGAVGAFGLMGLVVVVALLWRALGSAASRGATWPWETQTALAQAEETWAAQTSTARALFTDTPTPWPQRIVDDYGHAMVLIPAGEFTMGGDADDALQECRRWRYTPEECERAWFEDEEPAHRVYLEAFYIDLYEVTNAQYARFLNEEGNQSEGGSTWLDAADSDVRIHQRGGAWVADAGYEDHPVVEVSWYGARAYCRWRGADLPTEAQWEKAARGGLEGKRYPWGDEFDGRLANFCDANCEYDWKISSFDDGYGGTAPVGRYAPNGYGLFDMAGNVWEWVWDWYEATFYGVSPYENPSGPASGQYRGLRGGAWYLNPSRLRVAIRYRDYPFDTFDNVGFRCARLP